LVQEIKAIIASQCSPAQKPGAGDARARAVAQLRTSQLQGPLQTVQQALEELTKLVGQLPCEEDDAKTAITKELERLKSSRQMISDAFAFQTSVIG
jgi:hypothetical protein